MPGTPVLIARSDAPKRLSRLAEDIRTLSLQLKLADTDICPHDGSDWAKSLEASIQRCRSSADDVVQAILRLTAKSSRSVGCSRRMKCQRTNVMSDTRISVGLLLDSGKTSCAVFAMS